MKNSTLLRIFFISIGLPLARASSSTSSVLAPKSKSKPASVLVDTTNVAPAVQLEGAGTEVPSVPEEISVSGIEDTSSKKLETSISSWEYDQLIELGDEMSKDEFLRHLCQVITTIDQFKGLYEYLKQRDMVPAFLAHGGMVLVREVIVGTKLLETDSHGQCNSIYDAIALSLKGDHHERAAGLFKAAHERPKWKNMFEVFVRGFFERYPLEKNNMPLKRFLTLHGEEFGKKHPVIFKTIREELVLELQSQLDNPTSQRLLTDLVAQPSLLTPGAYAGKLLCISSDTDRVNFIKYGYREAIEKGLEEWYQFGGRMLWAVMVSKYPTQFFGAYPSTNEARSIALKDFPTKQDREKEWIKENTPILLARLEVLMPRPLPRVLWNLIFEYEQITFTWIHV